MPELGDIKKAGELGYKWKNKSMKFIYSTCEV